MVTAVEIANLALAQLGQEPITAFTDPTVEAQLCARFYPVVRDTVLEDHNWTFAIQREGPMEPDATAVPPFQYTHAFPLPAATLRVLLVTTSAQPNFVRPQNAIYAVEGKYILANYDVVYAKLLMSIEATGLFSASFVDALACRLAAEICIAVTNSRQLADQLFKLYGFKISVAARSDGMQGTSERMPPGSLITLR